MSLLAIIVRQLSDANCVSRLCSTLDRLQNVSTQSQSDIRLNLSESKLAAYAWTAQMFL